MSAKDALILALAARDQRAQEELARLRAIASGLAPRIKQSQGRHSASFSIFVFGERSDYAMAIVIEERVSEYRPCRGFQLLRSQRPVWKNHWENVHKVRILKHPTKTHFVLYGRRNDRPTERQLCSIEIASTELKLLTYQPFYENVFHNPLLADSNLASRLQEWIETTVRNDIIIEELEKGA